MAQKTGALIFDEQTDRYDIRFDLADYYGGLHCGECMEVFVGDKWKRPVSSTAKTGIWWYPRRGLERLASKDLMRQTARNDYPMKRGRNAGTGKRENRSPLHQDRETDRRNATTGYEKAACTDEKAGRPPISRQADVKAAYEAERRRFQH